MNGRTGRRGKILPLNQPPRTARSFRAPRRHARRNPFHSLGPVGQFVSHQSGVHVDIMAADSGRRRNNCRQAPLRESSSDLPAPRKAVERRIIKPPPTETAKPPLRTDAPQPTYLCLQPTTEYPASPSASAARKARKPTPNDCQHRTKNAPLKAGDPQYRIV